MITKMFWDIFRAFAVYFLKSMAQFIDLVSTQDSKRFHSAIYKTVLEKTKTPAILLGRISKLLSIKSV